MKVCCSFWTMVLEKTLESPLDSKEIKPVDPEGNQPWIFTGRTDAEAEAPIICPPDTKSQLIEKDRGQEEKVVTENEMVGWRHQLNGHKFEKFEQTPRDCEGQGCLACCSLWVTESRTWLSYWTSVAAKSMFFRSSWIFKMTSSPSLSGSLVWPLNCGLSENKVHHF